MIVFHSTHVHSTSTPLAACTYTKHVHEFDNSPYSCIHQSRATLADAWLVGELTTRQCFGAGAWFGRKRLIAFS
jgi:hypothetical protein